MNEIETYFYNHWNKCTKTNIVIAGSKYTLLFKSTIINNIGFNDDTITAVAKYQNVALNKTFEVTIDLSPQVQTITGKIVDFDVQISIESDIYYFDIEIDGYEWHDKTKEQATKDKQRERELIKLGYNIIRFSGQEVFNKPMSCVMDALECIFCNITTNSSGKYFMNGGK